MFKPAIFLSLAVAINVIVALLFKQSSRSGKDYALVVFVCGILLSSLAALCYTKSLASIDLSVAYPVFAAASIILICLSSRWVFSETISLTQACGMLLII